LVKNPERHAQFWVAALKAEFTGQVTQYPFEMKYPDGHAWHDPLKSPNPALQTQALAELE
jgi:hypothetical protein